MRLAVILSASIFPGCGQDIKVSEHSKCNGQVEGTEESVDAPFDADQDGYFDGGNPDCQETYDASLWDCNDQDAEVNPSAAEAVCNGVDDDCSEASGEGADPTPDDVDADGDGYLSCDECDDGDEAISPGVAEITCNEVDDDCDAATLDDEGCDIDYTGMYALSSGASYSCTFGLVNLSVNSLTVVDVRPVIQFAAGGSQPGTMTGTLNDDDTFAASNTLSGTCTETYTFEGAFVSEDQFTGTLTASFVGSCFDCVTQTWTLDGYR